jgi:hypothetical protein
MPSAIGRLIEIRQEPDGLSGVIACPPGMQPSAGQYLLASSDHPSEVIPTVLFPAALPGEALRVAPPLPEHWTVGQTLHLRGPLGSGFTLPDSARRVALCADRASPSLLLPLAVLALDRGAAVALYTRHTPVHLPAAIEILPIELLPEAPAWADYLAACCPQAHLAEFRRGLGLAERQPGRCQAQVLLLAPMPCAGLAECGVCAVRTRQGWRHLCTDGPVFNLDQLEDG